MSRPGSPAPRDVIGETPQAPPSSGKTFVKTKGPKNSGQPSVSLAKIMDLPNDVHRGQGIYHSASFVPDTRFFVLALCTFIGRVFSATDYEASQFVTPPSLIAYNLFILYFLYFYRDMHSKSPSLYAREFTDFARYAQLLKIMQDVYIPDEIFEILKNYSTWSPEMLPNLQFQPTLGSTLALYDIPYLMHPLIFLHGHNTLFNRADTVGQFGRFLSQGLFSMTAATIHADPRTYLIGNLLGCLYQEPGTTNVRLVQNWLSRVILPFVDPATHRQHLRRTGLSQFDLETITDVTAANWNPYRFLFSTESSRNFESFLDCAHACSEFTRDQLKASKTFKDLLTSAPHAPGAYMIMGYSSPTWSVSEITPGNVPTTAAITNGSFSTLHDTHTRFGVAPTMPTRNANTLTIPPTAADNDAPHPQLVQSLYMVTTANTTETNPLRSTGLTLEARSEMKHTTPNVLVFSPGDVPADAALWPMVTGIVVHNGNIDSTIVKTPNPTDDLPLLISRYIDGFVSLRVIRPRFAARSTYLIIRQAIERVSYATLGLLWRSDIVNAPRTDVGRNAPAMGSSAALMWPFRFITRSFVAIFGTNLFTSEVANAPTDERMIQVADAWSSFRVTSDSNARPSITNTSFGINHGEVIFGRNSTIQKFSHPSDLLRRN